MDLQCVRIQNFLSIADQTIDYRGSGVSLVLGPNGVGKSALFVEPLLWLFYDQLNRTDLKRMTTKVRRRYRRQDVDGATSVEAWFTQSGRDYYIRRSLDDGWQISADGVNMTPYRTKADVLPVLEQLIGLPANLFRSIAVMGQGFSQRFTGFKDSDRTSVVEDFIGAAVFEDAHENAQTAGRALANRLQGLSAATKAAEGAVAATTHQLTTAQQQYAGVRVQIEESRQRLETESGELGAQRLLFEQNAGVLLGQQEELATAVQTLEGHQTVAQSSVSTHNQALGSHNAVLFELTRSRKMFQGLGVQCPTCRGVVSPDIIAQELRDNSVRDDMSNKALAQSQLDLQMAQKQVQEVDQQLREKHQAHTAVGSQIQTAKSEMQRIDQRFQGIQTELSQLGDLEITYEQNLRALATRMQEEQASLTQAREAETAYTSLQPYVDWWTEHYSVRGLRSWRLGGVLETMNVHLAQSCMKLFDGEIMVRLLPVKPQASGKSKSVVSVDVDSAAGCYDLSSGGQARCIDLAIHFAFRRLAQSSANGWSSNFLIGDEVFDHLDRQVAERALSVLRSEASRVFIITHSSALQAYCDSVIRIGMVDEQTRILVA